jgi:iron complex outermembrane receptor protein
MRTESITAPGLAGVRASRKSRACHTRRTLPIMVGMICATAAYSVARAEDQPNVVAPAVAAGASQPGDASAGKPKTEGDQGIVSTRTVVSREQLDSQSAQNSFDALKNVPGVIDSDTKGGVISDDISIRGIHLTESSSYRLNGGFPIYNNVAIFEDKERVEALKGVSALLYGLAPPAGVINLVTKRAGDRPVTAVTLSGTSFAQAMAALDVGRKFGADDQFGVRVNLAAGDINKGVIGADGTRLIGTLAGDWQATDRLSFKVDFESYKIDVIEQASVSELKAVNGVVPLPHVIDPTRLLSGPWAKYRTAGTNILVGTKYEIGAGWNFVAEAGRSEADRMERTLARISNYDLVTGQGTEKVTFVRDQVFVNTYAKTELNNKTDFGLFTNDLTIGVNRNERSYNNPSSTTLTVAGGQNLYNPFPLLRPTGTINPVTFLPQDSNDLGFYAYDTVGLFDRLRILAGIRHTAYRGDDLQANGTHSITTTNVNSPAVGAILDVTPDVALYANYMKGLEETGAAPLGAANQFQVLQPAPSSEYEVGIRATNIHGFSATLARFGITRANTVLNPVTNIFGIDGTTDFQGWESTASFDLSREWNIRAGGQLMQAVQHADADPAINGLEPENTPKVSGNVSLTYRPEWLHGLRLTGGATYVGVRQINPQDQGLLPAVTLYSLGAGYVTKIGDQKFTFNLNVTNLMDTRYWSSTVSNVLGIGMSRTFKFSARVEF